MESASEVFKPVHCCIQTIGSSEVVTVMKLSMLIFWLKHGVKL